MPEQNGRRPAARAVTAVAIQRGNKVCVVFTGGGSAIVTTGAQAGYIVMVESGAQPGIGGQVAVVAFCAGL